MQATPTTELQVVTSFTAELERVLPATDRVEAQR
jgi:hypothetical protein